MLQFFQSLSIGRDFCFNSFNKTFNYCDVKYLLHLCIFGVLKTTKTTIMATLKNTKENKAKIKALKKINETKWVGNTVLQNMQFCLASINLESGVNSGWYDPTPVRLAGLAGAYMVNQDGSLCYDFRVIKISNNEYRIETLTSEGFNEFERFYRQFINE